MLNIIIPNKLRMVKKLFTKGSSTLLRAHGRVGASETTLSFLSAPPSEKSAGGFQQAGKKEGGWGEGIFARLPSREAGLGWERLRSLAPSREAKQNIFQFLLEEGSRAKIEKREKCFALRPASGGGGAAGRVNSVQSRFALRSVIATDPILPDFQNVYVGRNCRTKLEPFLNKIPNCRASRGRTKTERSGGQKGRGLEGRNFCPPSLSQPPNFVFRFAKCAARKYGVVFAPPSRAHTTEFLLPKILTNSISCSIILIVPRY